MLGDNKKILIIDEAGFSRICSALLESEGYYAETVSDIGQLGKRLDNDEFLMVIASYPFSAFYFNEIKKRSIPSIILSDHVNSDLISMLEGFNNSFCMIKPLDYHKFRAVVKQVMSGDMNIRGGCTIV
jgi:DNA-binding NtrC family response regulator